MLVWRWCWTLLLLSATVGSQALANGNPPETELAQALRQNNLDELTRSVDALALKSQGREGAEVAFYRGLLEMRRDRLEQALTLFGSVAPSSSYYFDARNNMGAIYARQGKLELAKTVMEEALQSHPGISVLSRNLSNLRAHMASKSYATALQMLDPPKADRPNLVVLTGGLAREQNKTLLALAPDKATTPAPPVAASTPPSPTPPPPPPPPSSTKAAEPLPAPALQSTTGPASELSAAATGAKTALLAWRAAWESKDLERYFQAYAKDYSPSDGKSRSSWMRDRENRITSKGNIKVRLEKIEVQALSAQHVQVRFRQHYDSDRFKSVSSKLVEMKWLDQAWRITLERNTEGATR